MSLVLRLVLEVELEAAPELFDAAAPIDPGSSAAIPGQ